VLIVQVPFLLKLAHTHEVTCVTDYPIHASYTVGHSLQFAISGANFTHKAGRFGARNMQQKDNFWAQLVQKRLLVYVWQYHLESARSLCQNTRISLK